MLQRDLLFEVDILHAFNLAAPSMTHSQHHRSEQQRSKYQLRPTGKFHIDVTYYNTKALAVSFARRTAAASHDATSSTSNFDPAILTARHAGTYQSTCLRAGWE